MKFIANLVPREGKFFEYFNEHASLIAQGSAALTNLLRNYDDVSVRRRASTA